MNHDKTMGKIISAQICIVNTVDRNQEMLNIMRFLQESCLSKMHIFLS